MNIEFQSEALQHFPLAVTELSPGWECVLLAEIAATISPGFASGKHSSDGSGIPHLRPMNVDRDGNIDLNVVKSVVSTEGTELAEGDVLFNNTNSSELIGKTALISIREKGYAYSNHMTRIRPESGIASRYVALQLHFLWIVGYARHRCTNHVNQASISSQTLAKTIPFLLPPAAEQTRIVTKVEELLSDLDAGVAELKAAQKKLGQYRQSLLKAAVEGALTADWRAAQHAGHSGKTDKTAPVETGAALLARILTERRSRWETRQLAKFQAQGKPPPKDWQSKYPAPVAPETTGLPALPAGWVWSSLGQCFQVAVGATPSRKASGYWGGGIPWVSSGEVRFNRITESKETISEEGLNNSSTRLNPVGSVLLGMIGEGKTRGQVAILDIEAANNQNCAAIWASETDVPPEYVYFWMWSRYDETRRGSSGNNQPALNKSIVENIPFPLPPLDELQQIVPVLSAALLQTSEQEAAVEYSLKQSAAQRKNILQAAFSGQLVPQDSADEPASALLARIRAERDARETGAAWGRGKKKGGDMSNKIPEGQLS